MRAGLRKLLVHAAKLLQENAGRIRGSYCARPCNCVTGQLCMLHHVAAEQERTASALRKAVRQA